MIGARTHEEPWSEYAPRRLPGVGLAAVVLVLGAVFAGFFALGRASSKSSAARPEASPPPVVAATGAAIPAALDAVPALAAPAPQRPRTQTRTAVTPRTANVVSARALVAPPVTPSEPAGATNTAAPAQPVGQSHGSQTPAPEHKSSGGGGGATFDTSG